MMPNIDKALKTYAVTFALLLFSSCSIMAAFDEYQIKAAFIFNFMKFIEWDKSSSHMQNDSINLVLLGKPSRKKYFDILTGRNIDGKKITVTEVRSYEEIPHDCDILYILEFDVADPDNHADELTGLSALTIADKPWSPRHFHIIFSIEQSKVRFSINNRLAKAAKIRIDSRLLNLAQSVDE